MILDYYSIIHSLLNLLWNHARRLGRHPCYSTEVLGECLYHRGLLAELIVRRCSIRFTFHTKDKLRGFATVWPPIISTRKGSSCIIAKGANRMDSACVLRQESASCTTPTIHTIRFGLLLICADVDGHID